MPDDRGQRLEEIREKYGAAVEAWCLSKEEEGEIPSEERLAKRVKPSERPPPPA